MILLAAAVAVALPFAPPLDRPLRYAIEERRGDERYRMIESVSFTADGDGYVLTIIARDLIATGPAKDRIAAGMRPWIGLPLRIRLAHSGMPIAVIDPQTTWDALVAGIRAMKADAMADAFAHIPPADRKTQLLQAADDILATTLPAIAPGEQTPLADGSVTRVSATHFVVRHGQPPGAVRIEDRIDIAPVTGLVALRVRVRTDGHGVAIGETRIEPLPG